MAEIKEIHFHCKLKFGDKVSSEHYCVDLVFDRHNLETIELKLYSKRSPEIRAFLDVLSKVKDLKEHFIITEITTKNYESLDFSDSEILTIHDSSNLDYTSIGISQVKYEWKRYDLEEVESHIFFLNEPSKKFCPINRTSFDGRGKWEDKTETEEIQFLDCKFRFANEFHIVSRINDKSDTLSVSYIPYLEIFPKKELSERKIILYGEIICLLASFFMAENIEYFQCIINKEERQNIALKICSNRTHRKGKHSYTTNYRKFKTFIDSMSNPNGFIENHFWWKRNIGKLITSTKLDGESKFLILYNIIEQSLTLLRKRGEIKKGINDSYFAGVAKNLKEIKDQCRKLVESIREFIPPDAQKELQIYDKQNTTISFCKNIVINKSSLNTSNKIQLVLKKLEIDPTELGIESLKELIKLRDDIVHSSREIEYEEINRINKNLAKLVNLILLRLLNISNELSRYLSKQP